MCSAWAKSKPFLWAVMLPVFSGVVVSWFGLMRLFGSDGSWFWAHVVGRLLLGTVPGVDLAYTADARAPRESLHSLLDGFSPATQFAALATPELWIGAAVGIVFIAAAIWLRQRRDEI
jgi:ABC-2 type transport system permease protein